MSLWGSLLIISFNSFIWISLFDPSQTTSVSWCWSTCLSTKVVSVRKNKSTFVIEMLSCSRFMCHCVMLLYLVLLTSLMTNSQFSNLLQHHSHEWLWTSSWSAAASCLLIPPFPALDARLISDTHSFLVTVVAAIYDEQWLIHMTKKIWLNRTRELWKNKQKKQINTRKRK